MLDVSAPAAHNAPAAAVGHATIRGHLDVDKAASTRARHEGAHEALHDDFFDAGEQGLYDGGHGAAGHDVLEDELEHDVPRLIVRTPEQEYRRNRMMRVVGVVVGVVLGVLVFAVLRGRGSSTDDAKIPPTTVEHAVTPPAPVAPPPPPAVTPPPEPEVLAPPPPEVVAPAPVPEEKPVAEKPAPVVRPAEPAAAPTPRPRPAAGEPAPRPAAPQPRPAAAPATGATPAPIPTGKPPTVSFPD
jgi:hypothetical protein